MGKVGIALTGTVIVVVIILAVVVWKPQDAIFALNLPQATLPTKTVASSNFTNTRPAATSFPSIKNELSASTQSNESKQALVNQLIKTGKPEDAFAAYKILLNCKLENRCGDLSAGQQTMAYNLLKQAVAGHVPKSSIYLLITTPDGRPPYEVNGDPAYADWLADAKREIDNAAKRGDVTAMSQMAELFMRDGQPEKALSYWTAYMDRTPSNNKQVNELLAATYSEGLTPEKVAAAVAKGHSIGYEPK